jgi:NAD-dependent deacetylase
LFKELSADAVPNKAHIANAELYHLGKLDCVITQNIDNLHQKAGVPYKRVLELHGNLHWFICLNCRRRYTLENIKDNTGKDEDPPVCDECGGLLKADVVFFGEELPEEVLNEAVKRACTCDLMIVVGSGLTVYPAAYLPAYATDAGARLVIINLTPTPFDGQATIVVNDKAGDTLSAIAHQVKDRLFYK